MEMTLAEFIKSKRHVACLETAGCITGELDQEGWIYGETGLFIEGPKSGIQCSLMIENSEYCTQEMFPLEGMLYEYAVEEGFVSGDRWSQQQSNQWEALLINAMPIRDEDEGSDDQIQAMANLHDKIEREFGIDMQDQLTSYSMQGCCTQEYMQVLSVFILGKDIFLWFG